MCAVRTMRESMLEQRQARLLYLVLGWEV